MSQGIITFLEGTVREGLPALARRDPYLGPCIIAGGIEFLGACTDSYAIKTDKSISAQRFCKALNKFFPIDLSLIHI